MSGKRKWTGLADLDHLKLVAACNQRREHFAEPAGMDVDSNRQAAQRRAAWLRCFLFVATGWQVNVPGLAALLVGPQGCLDRFVLARAG